MFRFPPMMPYTRGLLITLGVTFVASIFIERFVGFPIARLLALHPGLGLATAWQVFTYPFAAEPSSGGVLSLLISLIFIWLMMAPFEARFGPKAALWLTIVSVVAGGVAFVVASLVLPGGLMVGTWPLLLGLIAAIGATMPWSARVSIFGVLPMTNAVATFGWLGLSILMMIADGNFAGVGAVIGAFAGGFYLMRGWMRRGSRSRKPKVHHRPRAKAPFHVIKGGAASDDDDKPRWLN